MSLDPDALDIGIATATYQDMLQMVDDEKKLRKNLLEWVSNKITLFIHKYKNRKKKKSKFNLIFVNKLPKIAFKY